MELSNDPNLRDRIDEKASEFSWTAYTKRLMDELK